MASLSANQIKFIRSLGQKKFRQESGLFIAEGEKVVQEALQSDFTVREVYRMEEIGQECMGRITCLASPSPVLAVIEQKQICKDAVLDRLLQTDRSTDWSTIGRGQPGFGTDPIRDLSGNGSPLASPLCLALDGIRDPGNLGTILRLADWFGINAVFASEDTVELYNPKVVQATMGAIFRKTVVYGRLPEVIARFSEAGLPVYGTYLDGENLYRQELERRGLIVMGSESLGISPEIGHLISHRLFIPPYPEGVATSESLNVAIATAVICAEFRANSLRSHQ